MRRVRKAVFPVAGLGTRFLPATKAIPKEMLTVVDKPVIQYVVDEAREAGIEHFIFVTGRNKAVIEDHFDRAVRAVRHAGAARQGRAARAPAAACSPIPGQTSFTRQQVPLGLGHAVWCARDLVGNEPFALLLPDMIMQSEKSCMKEMVDLYAKTGGNIIGVQECDPAEAHKYGIVGDGDAVAYRLRTHQHGGEAESGNRSVQPLHQRPLHPAAGDLQHSGEPGARRRQRDPAHRRHAAAEGAADVLRLSTSAGAPSIADRRKASSKPMSHSRSPATICATA